MMRFVRGSTSLRHPYETPRHRPVGLLFADSGACREGAGAGGALAWGAGDADAAVHAAHVAEAGG